MKLVALALWYDGFVPDIRTLEGVNASQAGYVLDKLTRYNCLKQTQKNFLRSQLLFELKRKKDHAPYTGNSRDALVKEWGTSLELKKEFQGLLNYQRRSHVK